MSQLTRDYKGAGRRNLHSGGLKEFAFGILAGALLAGGIATLIAAHGRHRQARQPGACTAAQSTKAPGNAPSGSGPAAAAPGAGSVAARAGTGSVAAGTGAAHVSAAPAQHYDFYQMLPRLTVPVPAKSSAAPARRPSHPAASPSYLLQVGSYSSAAQARQVLKRLERMGLGAQIQQVTERGTALERVRVGPVAGAGLVRARRKLAAAGFHPLLIPIRSE